MMRRNFLWAAGLMAAGLSFHSRAGEKSETNDEKDRPITLDTTIGELLRRPEFAGYAEYLLPLEFGYRKDWTMRDIPRLLPYHTGVDPKASVAILNRLSDRARRGEKVWIDLGREDVGLFAFPGRKGAPFVIVCPGGGFAYVGSIHEGFPYAEAFVAEGMNAFVLQYRTGSGRWTCEDLADAILHVRAMADVDPDGYALAGSSAGARMAVWLGSYGTEAFGRPAAPRPAAPPACCTGSRCRSGIPARSAPRPPRWAARRAAAGPPRRRYLGPAPGSADRVSPARAYTKGDNPQNNPERKIQTALLRPCAAPRR